MNSTSTIPASSQDEELKARVRNVHRKYPTGVTVVTTAVDGIPFGLAVNAFSSISMDPPLVLVCVNESAKSYPAVFEADHIGINILSSEQKAIAANFARSGGDKFSEIDWDASTNGTPILAGLAGHFELEVKYKIPAYTHTIFIGEVVDAKFSENAPLVYQDGRFFDGTKLEELD